MPVRGQIAAEMCAIVPGIPAETEDWRRPLLDNCTIVPTILGRSNPARCFGSWRPAWSVLCSLPGAMARGPEPQSCQRKATQPAASRRPARRAKDGGHSHSRHLEVVVKRCKPHVWNVWQRYDRKNSPVIRDDGHGRYGDTEGARRMPRTLRARARTRADGCICQLIRATAVVVHCGRFRAAMRRSCSTDQHIIATARPGVGRHHDPLRQGDDNRRQQAASRQKFL
jgi:hypothetical protein